VDGANWRGRGHNEQPSSPLDTFRRHSPRVRTGNYTCHRLTTPQFLLCSSSIVHGGHRFWRWQPAALPICRWRGRPV